MCDCNYPEPGSNFVYSSYEQYIRIQAAQNCTHTQDVLLPLNTISDCPSCERCANCNRPYQSYNQYMSDLNIQCWADNDEFSTSNVGRATLVCSTITAQQNKNAVLKHGPNYTGMSKKMSFGRYARTTPGLETVSNKKYTALQPSVAQKQACFPQYICPNL